MLLTIISRTEEICVYAGWKRGNAFDCEFILYGMLIIFRYCDYVVKRPAYFSFNFLRFSPLCAKYQLPQRMFFRRPFPFPQQELDVVFEYHPRSEAEFQ